MASSRKARRFGARAVTFAGLMATACVPPALASHVGEEFESDQQVESSTGALLSLLRQYERMPAAQREALLPRLQQAAAQRQARLLALLERNPKLAAMRLLPDGVRQRMPSAVRPLLEQDVSIAGTVLGEVADDPAAGRSQTRLELLADGGRRLPLHVADAAQRDQLGWVGKRAQLSASRIGERLLVADRRRLTLLAAGSGTGADTGVATPDAVVQGTQNTLVVLLNFSDKPVECTPAELASRMFGNGATVDQGFRESSNGAVSFAGRVVGPFTISYSSVGACDYNGWASAANAAALAAGVNPSSYQRVSYATPRNASCGWSGLGALGGPTPSRTWVQQCTSTGLFSHELGHNLNFHHASTPGSEYGDGSDPMGAAKLVQSNAPNRVMAGWLSGPQVLDVAAGGSYSLAALEGAAAGTPQVLRLRKADTAEYYYLSLRQPAGLDGNLWPQYQNTVSVHRSAGTLPAYTVLLASLAAGQSWTDAANGITVSSQGVAGGIASVSVALGGATCTRQAPALSASPAAQTAAPGATLGYALTLTNRDSAACAPSTFALAQMLPAGFSGAFAGAAPTVAPGASATVGWNVVSPGSSADAQYTLSATATSNGSGLASSAAHASYTVLAPVVVVTPPADTTAPALTFQSPADGAVLTGRYVDIAASANDDRGVAAVEFWFDGRLLVSDAGAPYGTRLNLRKVAKGAHALKARAVDTSGNVTERSITVTLP